MAASFETLGEREASSRRRRDESPAWLAPDQIERDVETRYDHDVAEQRVNEGTHRFIALHEVPEAPLDAGTELREERVVGRRRAVGRSDPGGYDDGDLSDLLDTAPVDDPARRMRVAGDEGLRTLAEYRVDRPGQTQVDTQVIGDQAEDVLRVAGTGSVGRGFEHSAAAAREVLEFTLAIEESLDLARERGPLAVLLGVLQPQPDEVIPPLSKVDLGSPKCVVGSRECRLRGLEVGAELLARGRGVSKLFLGGRESLDHTLGSFPRRWQRFVQVNEPILRGGALVESLQNSIVLGLHLRAEFLVGLAERARL